MLWIKTSGKNQLEIKLQRLCFLWSEHQPPFDFLYLLMGGVHISKRWRACVRLCHHIGMLQRAKEIGIRAILLLFKILKRAASCELSKWILYIGLLVSLDLIFALLGHTGLSVLKIYYFWGWVPEVLRSWLELSTCSDMRQHLVTS